MKKIFIFIATAFIYYPAISQVGIGTTTPNAKAVLDITGTGKGLLIPRMDSVTRVQIASPIPDGLMVFQTDGRKGFWYALSGSWIYMPDQANAYDNLGNHNATQRVNLQNQLLVGSDAINGAPSTTGLRINGSGQVGIGTNNPSQLLQLGSSSYPKPAFLKLGAGNGTALREWEMGVKVNPANISDVSGENFSFAIRDATSNMTRLMIEYVTGGVGIGATPGNNRLKIQTENVNENGLYVGLTGASIAPSLNLEHNGSNFIVRPYSAGGVNTVIENTLGSMIINSSGGNVGIGKIPEERLDVAGTVQANQFAYATAQTRYLTIPLDAFSSADPEAYSAYRQVIASGGAYFPCTLWLYGGVSGQEGFVTAPVNLPQGAIITKLELTGLDADGTSIQPQATLSALKKSTTQFLIDVGLTAQATVTTESASWQTVSSSMNHTVSNEVYGYKLAVKLNQNSANTRLIDVRITYTVKQPD